MRSIGSPGAVRCRSARHSRSGRMICCGLGRRIENLFRITANGWNALSVRRCGGERRQYPGRSALRPGGLASTARMASGVRSLHSPLQRVHEISGNHAKPRINFVSVPHDPRHRGGRQYRIIFRRSILPMPTSCGSWSRAPNPANRSPRLKDLGEVVQCDLAETSHLRTLCQGIDTVVHLAGNPDASATWEHLLPTNIIGTYNLFAAAKFSGGSPRDLRFEHSCRQRISGGCCQVKVTEPVNPGDLYGVSKCFGEASRQIHGRAGGG